MIYLKGIHLTADSTEELHRFASRIVLGRSWFHPTPFPHYDIICPHKQERAYQAIEKILEKKKKREKVDEVKINLEVRDIFRIFNS